MVMITTPNPHIHDLLMCTLDSACVPFEVRQAKKDEYYVIIDGVPLDFDHALRWAEDKCLSKEG